MYYICLYISDHTNLDIVTAVTGALVNQSAEPTCIYALLDSNKPSAALVSLLRRVSFKDLNLSTLVCQVKSHL